MRNPWSKRLLGLLLRLKDHLKASFEKFRSKNILLTESEKQLRDSEEFLSSVIENIPNMIFVKEAETLRFVRFNRAGEKLLGQRREDLIGKNDYDFFPREQADFFVAKDREVLESGVEMTIEEENISVPGGIRILQTRKLPLMGPDGKPKYLLGISEDITLRKEHEAEKNQLHLEIAAREAAESNARRLIFLDAINNTLTSSLNINEALDRIAQILAEEHNCFTLIKTFNLENLSNSDIAWVRSQFPAEKIQVMNRDQLKNLFKIAHIELPTVDFKTASVAPLVTRDQIYGIIALFNKSEEYLDVQVFNLLDEITPRISLAIENAYLYARSQAASQAKSDFLANISHEVRTPLGAIIGFAELAQEKAEPGSFVAESLATIVRNSNQLLTLVNEVLDLSKVESKKMDIEKVPFPLASLLNDVHAILRMKAQQKNIRLQFAHCDLISKYFISDPLRLRQILLNLIGNSIKFTSSGHIRLRVYETRIDNKFSNVFFELNDTGIGMSPEQQTKIFSPFQQGDSSMTRRYGGTGLGLFLSRKLSELLGGELQLVRSALGEGSTFLLKLRLEVCDALKDNQTAETTKPKPDCGFAQQESSLADVLVVDDSAENRTLMDAYLNHLHIHHDLAENGRVALNKMLAKDYSMVFMDLQMPELDGLAVLKEARKHGYTGKVVALTAHAMKGDREHCLDNGFDDYLCKPLSRKTLETFLQSQRQTLH